ncbi:hypothetical protein [Plebeiibacterium sediminum]|uniref:Uncharacterized protein n=1 Tax=Plebeiibacterium sediminum TaxID=2992112 RepID=A0AAE3M1M9_9BACT|nr:hypothetical protein [Plebeiobacterium sediminum]MCW3785483.1 hypothetical protein [Plebeiobacterium sediminum]
MEQKGEVYYIGLLNKFNQSTNYKDKLEIFDKEFGILKANYATPLVTNTENTIFISDFDILPEEDNKLQLKFFNELVFTKIEIILDNNKAWDTWGYNRFNEYVAKKIEDNQFSLFDLGLMTNSFNNRIKKTGATKILFIKKELKTIKDSVESFKTQDNFNLSALFEDLQKGNSINFSRYNFGLAYEQFIGGYS